MTDIAIRVENLGKLYKIGARQASYKTLRETITDTFTGPFRKVVQSPKNKKQKEGSSLSTLSSVPPSTDGYIWALKDVSFKIKQGEVVGVIGRNGAGKTTLLKILTRITEPTAGFAEIHGRVGSLLEVGTGFHPELTGRENIFLNGAILGMRRIEVERYFDEIINFAELEKFVDTPVKHYSSGMYLRLAFAVAAYLNSEILLVDEVLAVGDAVFQKKCLGKMGEVAKGGRTVLFVSHNLGALVNLCSRAILLGDGKKWNDGLSNEVVRKYIEMGRENNGEVIWNNPTTAPGNDKIRLCAVRVVCDEKITADVDIQKDVEIKIEFWNFKPESYISTSIHLLDKMGIAVLASGNANSANLMRDEWFGKPHPVGLFQATCVLPGNFLNEGIYSINAIVLTDVANIEVIAKEAVSFMVHETGAMRKEYNGYWLGVVRPRLAWQTEYLKPLNGTMSLEKE